MTEEVREAGTGGIGGVPDAVVVEVAMAGLESALGVAVVVAAGAAEDGEERVAIVA